MQGRAQSVASVVCPGCGAPSVRLVGRIPDAAEFAGRTLSESLPGGWLWDCQECTLLFRAPCLERNTLYSLYRDPTGSAWETPGEERVDWALARAELEGHCKGGRILDIGCYDGRFLQSLDDRWELYGIELNRAAANRAMAAGISMVGWDFDALASCKDAFNVITAFDVVEHVGNPKQLLLLCAGALCADGLLIVATGNARSFAWRLLGARNLYCICAEHLAFISPTWCRRVAPETGLAVVSMRSFRRTRRSVLGNLVDVAKNMSYWLWPSGVSLLRRLGVGKLSHPAKAGYPPLWPSAKDHFLVVFQRRS